MVYPYQELHILFYSNGLAIWSGFPDIMHDLVSVWILPNFELIRAISKMDIWYKFWSKTSKIVEWIALTRKIVDQKKVKVIGVTERSNVKLVKL